jgi:putative transposase
MGPLSLWQARNLCFQLDERDEPLRFLIHDRDAKFCGPFAEVLGSEGMRIMRTPSRSPQANAVAERVVKTLRHEVLDWTLILGRRHLDRVLASYASHYGWKSSHWTVGGSFAKLEVGAGDRGLKRGRWGCFPPRCLAA